MRLHFCVAKFYLPYLSFMSKSIGLFFGSFNPVHVGHMIIANFMRTAASFDEVWMVISPRNPFKKKSNLAHHNDRYHLVQLAIGDAPGIRASRVEFELPIPSYTIDTLSHLRDKHPESTFSLIMGGDNLKSLPKWKNADLILRDFDIHVYTRPRYELGDLADHPRIHIHDGPLLHLSASYIRECLRAGKSIRYLVPDAVFSELERSSLYR